MSEFLLFCRRLGTQAHQRARRGAQAPEHVAAVFLAGQAVSGSGEREGKRAREREKREAKKGGNDGTAPKILSLSLRPRLTPLTLPPPSSKKKKKSSSSRARGEDSTGAASETTSNGGGSAAITTLAALLATPASELLRPQASILSLDPGTSVGDALAALASRRVLSAPVRTLEASASSSSSSPPEGTTKEFAEASKKATEEGRDFVCFVDVRDVLMSASFFFLLLLLLLLLLF